MKLGAQLYTCREFTKTPEDIYKTLEKVKKIGYNCVQLSGMGPIDAKLLQQYGKDLDLEFCATHTGHDRIFKQTEQAIADHKLWNCGIIGLGYLGAEFRQTKAQLQQFMKDITPALQKIHDAGLQFVYHNHNFEFAKLEGTVLLDYMKEISPEGLFHFELDTYWIQAGGASPAAYITKFADRLGSIIHFKDMKIVDEKPRICEIGQGNLDWPGICEAIKKTNTKYIVVEQDDYDHDPFESLAMSFEYVKKLGICDE